MDNDPFSDLVPQRSAQSNSFSDLVPQQSQAKGNPFSDLVPPSQPSQGMGAPALNSGNPGANVRGMGYPAGGLVSSTLPGTPSGMEGVGSWGVGLALDRALDATGQAAGAEGQAEQTQPGASGVADFFKHGIDWYKKQSPELGAEILGKATGAAEDATKQISSFLFSQPGKMLGEPQSAVASAEKASNDLAGYLFEGGNIGDVGRVPEVVRQTERGPMGVIEQAETGARNIPQHIVDVNTLRGTPAQGYLQIIDPTWRRYGGLETGYKSAIDAPRSVQEQIASRIPIKEWGPNTIAALRRRYPDIDINKTLGEEQTRLGGRIIGQGGAPEMIRERGDIRAPRGLPVGADVADLPEPRQPNAQWYKEQDDKLFQLRQQATADRLQMMQMIDSMPDEFKTPEMQERFYKYMEGDPNTELSPSEQAYYKTTIEPLKREERDLYEELKNTDLDMQDYDPTYAHRIVQGRAPVFDALSGERGATANPISGYKSLTAPSLKGRKFFALENNRTRKLVTLDNGKLTEINNRVGTPLQTDVGFGEDPIKGIGDKVKINGETFELRNARTDEIEANTDTQYYKNASANTIDNLLRLRAAARATFHFNDLKNSPEFAMIAKKVGANNIPDKWISPHMPLLDGYKMDPLMAHTIDDFYGVPKSDLHDKLAKINQLAVRSLFWSPLSHAGNAGATWVTARGWDNITPMGMASTFADGARAIKEVYTLGPKYREALKNSADLVYAGNKNRDFHAQMLKRLGSSAKVNPSWWDPIARTMGVGPSDIIKWWYNKSSDWLWGISDAFYMQRLMELQRKGLNLKEAITETDKYMSYRIPPQVLGQRAIAEFLKNPVYTEFSRYHYRMMSVFANIAKDLATGTGKEKFDAMGRIFTIGALMAFVWPAISYGIQKLTGDKDLEYGPKGPTKIPSDLLALFNHDKNYVNVLSDLVTIAPLGKTGLELYSGFDWFTGDKIDGPVDQVKSPVHQFGKAADYAASQLVQPYGMLEQAGRPSTSLAKEALKTGLGLRNKPKKYTPSKYDWRKDARRKKGWIEQGFDKL